MSLPIIHFEPFYWRYKYAPEREPKLPFSKEPSHDNINLVNLFKINQVMSQPKNADATANGAAAAVFAGRDEETTNI